MNVDIEGVLDALGLDYFVNGAEACALCPQHFQRTGKEDRSPSWWINLDSGMHTCFSCGYKGNLLQLVADVNEFYVDFWGQARQLDIEAAKAWLANFGGISVAKLAEGLARIPEFMAPVPKPVAMSDARLAIFDPPPVRALEDRNIDAESAAHYGVLWDSKTQTWILPFREPETDRLLGWQEKGTVDRTFKNRPAGLVKSKTLFGYQQMREDAVYVVESPLDAVRLHACGFPGAVAICGSEMSEAQVKLIRGVKKIIIAFDNADIDKAGRKASEAMLKWARAYGMNISYFNYAGSDKKDPGDLTDDEIARGIHNAKSFLYGERAYVSGEPTSLSG